MGEQCGRNSVLRLLKQLPQGDVPPTGQCRQRGLSGSHHIARRSPFPCVVCPGEPRS